VKKSTVTTLKPIWLQSALPASSAATISVALLPAGKFKPGRTDELRILGALITDAQGRALDGNADGQPGGDFSAAFGNSGVTFAYSSVMVRRMPPYALGIDESLERTR
jgi:hypothetical protein